MELIGLYGAYAAAFEHCVVDDDWTRVEPFFTDDIRVICHSEPFVGEARGMDEVIDYFRGELDNFDRRFDERAVEIPREPECNGNRVKTWWRAAFCRIGAPDLLLSGHEIATFRGERICRIDDYLDDHLEARVKEWMRRHADKLLPPVSDFADYLIAAARNQIH